MRQRRSKKFHHLRRVLIKHRDRAQERLHQHHRHLKKILKKHRLKIEDIRQKGAKIAATGAMVGAIASSSIPFDQTKARAKENDDRTIFADEKRKLEQKKLLISRVLSRYGPQKLTSDGKEIAVDTKDATMFKDENALQKIKESALAIDQGNSSQYENELAKLFKSTYGIDCAASLDNKRLNVYFGAIGQEQHLPRFVGDTASQHSDDPIVQRYGIAPGRGSWGLWAPVKSNLAEKQIEQEKYYIAAQTFLAPDWRDNPKELYDWFRYRKVIVVNPRNGSAVVAVIGDAGPASWTGKNFGGSPEVMLALDARDGHGVKDIMTGQGGAKDRVFVFLVDDPDDKIPLGPVDGSALLAINK